MTVEETLSEFARLPLDVWLREIEAWPKDDQFDAMRDRMRRDPLLYYSACFPELATLPFNAANRWMAEQFAKVPPFPVRWKQRMPMIRHGIELNRGGRKTTTLKLEIHRRMTFGMEPFVLWGGSDEPNARKESAHVRHMMRYPSRTYLELFGAPTVSGGDTSWEVEMPSGTWSAMERRGMPGQQTRGANVHGIRPTMIIPDDIETPKSVQNLQLRNELTDYEDSDVANAGPDFGGWLLAAGTRLHPDSQTARRAASPAYISRTFKAVLSWPERDDLWEHNRKLWADLTDPDREQTAMAFYEANRAEMDRGAAVLDSIARPIYACMVKLWSIGRRQFFRDYQNEPLADGNAIFDVEAIRRVAMCRFDPTYPGGGAIWRRAGTDADGQPLYEGPILLRDCKVAAWLDPRASRNVEKNDYAAIGIVAKDRHGYRYAIGCDMQRDKPSEGRARMWRVFEWLGPRAMYGYEDNGSQTLHGDGFEREVQMRRDQGITWAMQPRGYTSTDNKLDRIGRLQPDMELHGWFQVAENLPTELWNQLRDLRPGGGGHDDGPDALERADWLLSQEQDLSVGRGLPPWMRG